MRGRARRSAQPSLLSCRFRSGSNPEIAKSRAVPSKVRSSYALEMDSGSSVVLWNLGIALVAEGRHVDALTLFERAQEVERGSSLMAGLVAWGLAVAGKKQAARGQFTELEAISRYRHVPRYPLAWTLAALGETEAALDQYERALGEREPFLIFPLFPGNDPFRRESHFRAALEQMGLTWALSNPTIT